MKRRWGEALPSWCGARQKDEGFDPRRELRPAAPSTQASPAVRRESSDPSIGALTQGSPSIFVKPPEYSSNSHWTSGKHALYDLG
ncbi:hypothetical protein ACQJBY_049297 [Aegilops geniculata]